MGEIRGGHDLAHYLSWRSPPWGVDPEGVSYHVLPTDAMYFPIKRLRNSPIKRGGFYPGVLVPHALLIAVEDLVSLSSVGGHY